MSDQTKSENIKVGLFVLFLGLLLGATLFLVSGSTKLLEERYTLYGTWKDVGGLKEGAVVRLAGVAVGEVIAVDFSENKDRKLTVKLSVEKKFQDRIRRCTEADLPESPQELPPVSSEARIDTVGVLGDKYVSLTMGDTRCKALQDGEEIHTQEALDIVAYTKTATEIMSKLNSIGGKIDSILGSDEEAGQASLSRSFQNLEEITLAIKEGNGLINALLYDPSLKEQLEQTLLKTDQTADNLRLASRGISSAVQEVTEGNGLAHELIYGQDGSALAKELQLVAAALTELAQDIKSETSLINTLIYDPSKKQILEDLQATSNSLRTAAEALQNGDGTVALMMRDPTLYEDLRSLVGGAQRNKLLRAYIRRTVEESEKEDASGWETRQ